jgi:hypothetical protein
VNGTFGVTDQPITNFAGWAATANAKPLVGDFNGEGNRCGSDRPERLEHHTRGLLALHACESREANLRDETNHDPHNLNLSGGCMSKLTSCFLLSFTLLIMFAGSALAQSTHNVWSENKPLYVSDPVTGAHYETFISSDASFAWSQAAPRGFANARARVTPALTYDFMLMQITSLTADMITGRWNVRRNGVLVCNNCIGKAYGLSQPTAAGKYVKIYIGTPAAFAEKWHWSGYITRRFDF